MGTALDSLEFLNEPQGNSENIEQSKQDTVITMFSIIKTSEGFSCPSDRFRDVCVDYDSTVSSFQDIYMISYQKHMMIRMQVLWTILPHRYTFLMHQLLN